MQQNVRTYDPVSGSDIETGIQVPDTITVLIDNSTGTNTVSLNISLNDVQTEGIDANTTWIEHVTVAAGNIHYEVFEYGPTAIQITGSDANTKSWVKG